MSLSIPMSDRLETISSQSVPGNLSMLLEVRCRVVDVLPVSLAPNTPQSFPACPHWSLWEAGSDGDCLDHHGRHHLRKDQVICIPPGNAFTYSTSGHNSSCRLTFGLPDFDQDIVREYFPSPLPVPGITESLSKLTARGVGVIPTLARLQAFTLACVANLLETLPEDSLFFCSHRGSDLAIARPAISFIAENLHSKITIAHLSTIAGVSVDHFTRAFRRITGKTPSFYVKHSRISLAADKLRTTNDSIESIVIETGFRNRFHFTRVFSQIMGFPPCRYRRNMQPRPVPQTHLDLERGGFVMASHGQASKPLPARPDRLRIGRTQSRS